jgi:YfiH family protein
MPHFAPALGTTPHAFLGRSGGAESLFPDTQLVTVNQTHSALTVTAPFTGRPDADAIVTDRPGLLLGIITADCAPILFADSEAGVIGAAHAGWKGALSGITDSTIAAMEKLGAHRDRIAAAIGPCISRASYEVDDTFRLRFADSDPATERFFADGRRAGHFQFDLEAYVVHRLAAAGIKRIAALGIDTYSQSEDYFSFRRATHAGEPTYGRQLSVITLATVSPSQPER